MIASISSKECRLCHRIGTRGFLVAGGEGWECSNDQVCRARKERRDRREVEDRWNTAIDVLLNSRHTADPDIQGPFWAYVDGEISLERLHQEML